MTAQLCNMQVFDLDETPDKGDRKADVILLTGIIILLAGVAAYLVLNPDESNLRQGATFEGIISQPYPPEPFPLEPFTPTPVTSEPVASEPVASEPVASEPVASESVTSESVTFEPVTTEAVIIPEAAVPEPAMPDPAASHTDLTPNNKTVFAWAVNLVSLTTQSSADKIIEQLKAEGIEAEVIRVNVNERTYYRIRIADLANKQTANAAKQSFKDKAAYKDAWINRYPK